MIPKQVYPNWKSFPVGTQQITYAENQPEYSPLPCVKLPTGEIATRWVLDEKELESINQNGEFYLCISTFNQPLQPLKPMADQPDISEDQQGKPFFYSPLEWRREQGIADFEEQVDSGLPIGFRDAIYNDTQIQFGFWDRLKILFGWKVRLDMKTFTEKRQGKLLTESEIRVYRDRKLPKGWGVVESDGGSVNGTNTES
jgi:hypothetical protein